MREGMGELNVFCMVETGWLSNGGDRGNNHDHAD